jgi:hypothetical protein
MLELASDTCLKVSPLGLLPLEELLLVSPLKLGDLTVAHDFELLSLL